MLVAGHRPDVEDELEGEPAVFLKPVLLDAREQRHVQQAEEVPQRCGITLKCACIVETDSLNVKNLGKHGKLQYGSCT